MARKSTGKSTGKSQATKINPGNLTKGELRKLNMLKKSVGEKLGEATFAKWYAKKEIVEPSVDKNALLIEQALAPLIKSDNLKMPRGGYLVKRGKGRIIVERPKS